VRLGPPRTAVPAGGSTPGYWLTLLVVAGLVLAYAAHRNLYPRSQEHLDNRNAIRAKQRECEALEQKIQAAQRHVESLGNDPLEIEADIRRSKNLVRNGETIYRIKAIPTKDDPGPAATPAQEGTKP